jgi:hypothetical protein
MVPAQSDFHIKRMKLVGSLLHTIFLKLTVKKKLNKSPNGLMSYPKDIKP